MDALMLADLLKDSPLFDGLDEESIAGLHTAMRRRDVDAGTAIFRQGDPGDSLYLLFEGQVRIVRKDGEGKQEIELARLGPGAFFGDMALLDGRPRSATAIAETPCALYAIDRRGFLRKLMQSESMLSALLSGLSERVRSGNEQLYESALREQLLQAQAEMQRYLSISQMVARVAHEINTPIGIANQAATIVLDAFSSRAPADLARDDEARVALEDARDACKLIVGNLQRASSLIGAFKSLSARQVHAALETVDLGDAVRDVVKLHRVRPRDSSIKIDVIDDLPPDDRVWHGYPGYLSQAITNILSNAEKYAFPGGQGTIRIRIRAEEGGSPPRPGFAIVIQDDGVGMPPSSVSRVFEAFFTTGRRRGGTGLGMSIVKHLMSGPLEGRVDVVSEVDHGTSFTLWIPRAVRREVAE